MQNWVFSQFLPCLNLVLKVGAQAQLSQSLYGSEGFWYRYN